MKDITIDGVTFSINPAQVAAIAPCDDEHKVLWLSSSEKLIVTNADAQTIKNAI